MPPAILAGQGSAVAQDTSQRQIRRCRRRDRQRTAVATTIRPCRRCRKRQSTRPGQPPCQSPKRSNPHSAWRQRNGQTTRDFLHWRFSDAGNPRKPSQTPCNGVRETCTIEDIRDFHHLRLNSGQPLSRKWQFRPAGGHQMATAECANASIYCLPALTTEDFFCGRWSVSYGP